MVAFHPVVPLIRGMASNSRSLEVYVWPDHLEELSFGAKTSPSSELRGRSLFNNQLSFGGRFNRQIARGVVWPSSLRWLSTSNN